ncbi:MAG: hypothetical protein EOP02_34770, partial [Proteobacteria bacterium]
MFENSYIIAVLFLRLGTPILKPRISATLLLAGACGTFPLAHADDSLTLPSIQVQESASEDQY